jgi:hypothetical protein
MTEDIKSEAAQNAAQYASNAVLENFPQWLAALEAQVRANDGKRKIRASLKLALTMGSDGALFCGIDAPEIKVAASAKYEGDSIRLTNAGPVITGLEG